MSIDAAVVVAGITVGETIANFAAAGVPFGTAATTISNIPLLTTVALPDAATDSWTFEPYPIALPFGVPAEPAPLPLPLDDTLAVETLPPALPFDGVVECPKAFPLGTWPGLVTLTEGVTVGVVRSDDAFDHAGGPLPTPGGRAPPLPDDCAIAVLETPISIVAQMPTRMPRRPIRLALNCKPPLSAIDTAEPSSAHGTLCNVVNRNYTIMQCAPESTYSVFFQRFAPFARADSVTIRAELLKAC
jgi:hypothetical protein